MQTVLISLIHLYRRIFSPIALGACRFTPTCSEYMEESILRYGALTGILLGSGRLCRCHPLCPGGHDPVPTSVKAWTPSSLFH